MVDEIMNASRQASMALEEIKRMTESQRTPEAILPVLKKAVGYKLMLCDPSETDIRKLVIMSIKRQEFRAGNLPDEVIEKQIRKYDCHQTSLAAQKKVLLIMFLERELGVSLGDDEATAVETLEELSKAFAGHLKLAGELERGCIVNG